MIFILLCHFTQQSSNSYLNMLGQFFNIGVSMFIILSGFLFGTKRGQSCNMMQWMKRRILRIYIPYELFVILLLIIHLIFRKNVWKWDWLWLILGMQGSIVGVQGAEQTWFITSILLCYLATPMLDVFCNKNKSTILIISGLLILTPAILALIPAAFVYVIYAPICWYGLAYFVGDYFHKIQTSTKGACYALLIMCVALLSRLIARVMIDGTLFYNRIVTEYTHVIAAFALFYIVAFIAERTLCKYDMSKLSAISFEVYLYHYMFCVGPIRLFSVSENWVINCCIVTLITLGISILMKIVGSGIERKLFK